MMVAEGRLLECAEELPMRGKAVDERFDVLTASSSLTFFAASSSQSAYGKTTELGGYVNAAWNADGSLAREPAPQMHVDFKVESLHTGNDLQDREMWKLIDSKRFPKVAGDLTDFSPSAARGRYNGNGQITLAGLSRRYTGEFHLEREGDDLRLDGDLNVDVRDFGLKPLKLLVLSVAPLVRVRLRLVAARA
jgi:polyisoprenoid-binding protein YceI